MGNQFLPKLKPLRTCWFIVAFMALCMAGHAQVATKYQFTQTTGTYTPITGTVLTQLSVFDDSVIQVTNIPTFKYDGVNYNRMFVSTNGWIGFRATGNVGGTTNYTPIASGTADGYIVPFAVDLNNSVSGTPSISWAVVGTEIVVQWQNVHRYSTSATEDLSFQVHLDTVSGVISFIYSGVTGSHTSTDVIQVGLRGPSTTFTTNVNNRKLASGSSWSNTINGTSNSSTVAFDNSNGTVPSSGLTFRWIPLTCFPPTGLTTANITTNSADLSWTAPTSGTPAGYGWEIVAHNAGPYATPVAYNYALTTSANTGAVLAANTQYDIYIKTGCSLSNLSDTSLWSSVATFTTLATCIVPTALTSSAITNSGATISWTASTSSPANGYVYEAVATGAGSGATPVESGAVAAGVTTATFTALNAATIYDIYVKAACSSTDSSSWLGPISITTLCNPVSVLPWTEGFEGLTSVGAGIFPTCWSYANIRGTNIPGSDDGSIGSSYVAAHGGSKFLYSKYNDTAWIYTPGFQLTGGTSYDFSFWMANVDASSPTTYFTMDVAYGSSATPAGMTTPLITGNNASNTTYQQFSRTFTPATSGVYYFGVKSSSPNTTPWYLSFDDFRLQLTPSCVAPTALTGGVVTATSAGISWTASTSSPANGYVYEAVASGAGSGGTPVATGSVGAGVTTATITGLSATTTYDIYVRAACSGTDSSAWVGPLSVTTPCNAVTALPYTESFENATLTADCWSANAGAGYTYLWEPVTQDSTHGVFGPKTGSQFARLNVYNAETTYNPYTMTSPSIVLPAAMQQVSYWYFLGTDGYNNNTLRLLVSTNNGASWDTIYTHSTANSSYASNYNTSNWHKNTIYLPQYVNTTAIFRFLARSNYGSNRTNMGIDEFTISAAPTCFPPTGVTASSISSTSANLSWTAPTLGTPAGYAWEVVAAGAGSGATPIAGNAVTAPTTTASTGTVLTPSTTYDVYVKTGCSLSNLADTSTWSVVYSFTTPASCVAPTALTAPVVTSSGGTISWTASPSAPANGYIYKVVASGAGASGTAVVSGTTAAGVTTATISGLSATTGYDIYVRSVCSSTDSSAWAGPLSITTPCPAITTIPWTEDFEGMTSVGDNIFPSCWSYTNVNNGSAPGSDDGSNISSTYAIPHSGTHFLYTRYADTSWIFTPGFQLTAGTAYTFSYYMVNKDATSPTYFTMEAAYGTTASVAGMTTPLIAANSCTNTTYQQFSQNFIPATSGIYYFGVKSSSPNYTPWYLSFDDFKLDFAPACSAPSTPALVSTSTNSADVSWTASVSSPANGYLYEAVAAGAGSSATPVVSGTVGAGVTTVTVSGLSANTSYDIYVRSLCSVGDSSAWAGPLALTTPCATSGLPLIEGFNTGSIPTCWSQEYVNGSSSLFYPAANTMTNPPTNPQEGTNFVEWNSYNYPTTAGTETRLISRPLNTSGVPSVDISFYWLHDATDYTTGNYLNEGVTVQYSTDLVNWTDVQFFPRVDLTLQPTGSAWFQKLLTLPTAVANQAQVYIGFKFHSEYGNNCAFDNLHVYATPACAGYPSALSVSGITSTSATVDWTAASPAPAVGYHWILTPAGAGPGAGIDSGDVTGTTVNLSGLTPNTVYDFYVQTDCGVTGYGALAGPVTIQSICTTGSLPLIEGFNDTIIPSCWTQQYVVGSNDLQYIPSSYNPTTAPQEGSDYVYWNAYGITDGDETRLVSPPLSSTGISSVDVSFYFFQEHSTYYTSGAYLNEGMTVQYSTDLVNWTDVQFYSREDGSLAHGTGRWRQVFLTLPAGAGNQPLLYVGFKFHSENGDNVSFDNLHIFQSSPCAGGPDTVRVSPQSTTTATATWAAGSPAPASGYNWVVVASNDSVNGTIIASGSTAAGVTTANISGLTPNTAYDFYVQSNCGSPLGTGYWAGPTAFSTPCTAFTSIPWTESFESMTTVGVDFVPSCWLPTPSGRWESEDAPFFFPSLDARSGTHYLTDRYNADDTIYTPSFTLTGGTQYEFYFYYRTDGSNGWDSLYAMMGTSQSPSGMVQVIGNPVADITNTQYVKYSAIFTPATSGDYFFGVKLLASFAPNNIAFDDFGLQEVVPCPNPPLAGVITGPSSVCSGSQINLSLTGYSPYTQLQWQASLDTITWQDLAGANDDFYQDYPTSVIYYRVKVNCADSSYSPVFTVTMNAPTLCYCTSGIGGSCGGNNIDTALIQGTNFFVNYTTCNSTSNGDAYTAFPQIGDSTTTLQRGGSYTIYLHMTGTSISSVWIDFNQDGVFDSNEWVQPTVAATSGTATITVPASALLGTTGMRIRSRNQGNPNGSTDPCSNFGSGETFDFQLTITDTNCTHIPTVTPTASIPTCYGSSNGSLSIALSGGLAPFTHAWSTGDTTTSLTNLGAGVYTDTITFAGGCTYIYSDTLTQPAMLMAMDSVTPVLCYGGSTGSVTVSVSGGTGAYTHHWSNGATSAQLTGLATGVYTDTISDINGCVLVFKSDTVKQPSAAVSVVLDSTTNVKCNGQSNGAIYTTASGGTGTIHYAWTGTSQTSDDVTGLATGSYVLTVTDANQCTATLTDTVKQPNPIAIVTDSIINTKCNGSSDGSIYVHVTGGTIPYSYNWSPGGATTSSLFFKAAGAYTLTVTDRNGCTAATTDTIKAPAAINLTSNITNEVQNGAQGSITVTATGGTQPYSYHWTPGSGTTSTISNLTANLYTVTVTDANGCTATRSDSVRLIVGIKDVNSDITDIYVYPNPSSSVFNVTVKLTHAMPVDLEMYTVTGQKIDVATKENANDTFVIDMANEASGVYILKVKAGDQVVTQRVTLVK